MPTDSPLEAGARALSNTTAEGWCRCGDDDTPDDASCAFCTKAAREAYVAIVGAMTDVDLMCIWSCGEDWPQCDDVPQCNTDKLRAALIEITEVQDG